jgi:hypothetical protein
MGVKMMNPEPNPTYNPQEIYEYAVSLKNADMTESAIVENLMRRGLSEPEANAVIQKIFAHRKKDNRAEGKRNMIVGGLWLVGGIAVTVFTYNSARSGGSYVITWGPMIFGGIQFFRGLGQYLGML